MGGCPSYHRLLLIEKNRVHCDLGLQRNHAIFYEPPDRRRV